MQHIGIVVTTDIHHQLITVFVGVDSMEKEKCRCQIGVAGVFTHRFSINQTETRLEGEGFENAAEKVLQRTGSLPYHAKASVIGPWVIVI